MLALAIILSFVLSGTLVWLWSRIRIVNNELDTIESHCSTMDYTLHFIEAIQKYPAMNIREKFYITFNI